MNVTTEYPSHCPRGTQLLRIHTGYARYADGCWTTRNNISESGRRFHCDANASRTIVAAEYLAAWDEALAEDARLMEESHPDTPEAREYLRSLYDGPVIDAIRDELAQEHVGYLGEVPWSDRVED